MGRSMKAAISQVTDPGDEIVHLRERAKDHAAAENRAIAFKLEEVVRDLEARADEVECAGRLSVRGDLMRSDSQH
jgi:hypothetical protein